MPRCSPGMGMRGFPPTSTLYSSHLLALLHTLIKFSVHCVASA